MQVAVDQWRGNDSALRRSPAIGLAAAYGLLHSIVVFTNDRGFEPLLDEGQNTKIK